MLDEVGFLPDGTRVAVGGMVKETLRVLKFGDGILGWEGDPNMEIMVDLHTGSFDIWTLDLFGHPYMVLSRPYCDAARLVQDLLAADTRRHAVAEGVLARNKAVAAAAEADFAAEVEEHAERLQWALRRDLGHHYGGLTRMVNPVGGTR